jgi:hypothetical protein
MKEKSLCGKDFTMDGTILKGQRLAGSSEAARFGGGGQRGSVSKKISDVRKYPYRGSNKVTVKKRNYINEKKIL